MKNHRITVQISGMQTGEKNIELFYHEHGKCWKNVMDLVQQYVWNMLISDVQPKRGSVAEL